MLFRSLHTTILGGVPATQTRTYYVYRPQNLPTTTPVPALVIFTTSNGNVDTSFNTKADANGFIVVTASYNGNQRSGTNWNFYDPHWFGYDDYDYTNYVVNTVRQAQNCSAFFYYGWSRAASMVDFFAYYYPSQVTAACTAEGCLSYIPTNLPVGATSMMYINGTLDSLRPYEWARDTADRMLQEDGLLSTVPVTTYEATPLIPGQAAQSTWIGPNGVQVAMVTNIGGQHNSPLTGGASNPSGYNAPDGAWSFFSQFLTATGNVAIVSNPVNNYAVSGHPASFWVAATGTGPLSYQWQKNGVNIAGATLNHYTTPPTTTADNNSNYLAVVTNGTSSATSATASLTVSAAPAGPVITSQPADVTVKAGQALSFTVGASGTNSYQWYENAMSLPGATSATYTISPSTIHHSGATFYATVKNSTGTTTSNSATGTVLEIPGLPIVTAGLIEIEAPSNQIGGTFTATAFSTTPMTYQWQSANFSSNFANVPGATMSTYTPPASNISDTTYYQCVISNSVGSTRTVSTYLFVSTSSATIPPQQAPGFGGSTTPAGQVGVPFNYQIQVQQSTFPVTYSVSGTLAAGLQLNANTGLISGTPTAVITSPITITASNGGGSMSGVITIAITSTPPPISISDWRLANFGPSGNDALVAGDSVSPLNDGVPNLFAYALGLNPLGPATLPFTTQIQGGYLTLTSTVSPNATGITISALGSPDLVNWSTTNATVLQNNSAGFKAQYNTPVSMGGKGFLKIQVTNP